MSFAEGTRIGPYEIAALIGQGGMGVVYRATDARLKRSVAIKVLPESLVGDARRLTRFQREAEVLAALNHPNIAAIYGLERSGALSALVMELVEGPTLADRIARGPLPCDEALPIARQLADALEAAHEQGIVHRDLKPANIKVRPDGMVKVLDFGLAKAAEPSESLKNASYAPTVTTPAIVTGAGMILGTAAYMSPEQARGQPADRRSDIWSFGCVLYEMLAGKRAFGGEDVIDTLAEVRRADPDWAALPTDTPPSIHRLLRRCLLKDRKARLADVSAIRLEIDDAGTSPLAAPESRGKASFRFERYAWAAAVVMLAAAAAFAMRGAFRSESAPAEVHFEIEVPATTANTGLAIAPNGRLVAYLAGPPGDVSVWLHTMDGRPPRAIDGTRGAVDRLFWSPDSQSLGFFAGGKLKRVDVATGVVQTLTDTPGSTGASWSRNGVILFAPVQGPILRVSQAGGDATPVTRLEGSGVRHVSPQFLPDDRHFLFFVTGDSRARGVYAGDITGVEAPRRILEGPEAAALYASSGHLLFPRGGALMVQRFDAATLTLSGEPRQLVENVRIDATQGTTHVSASETGVLVYRRAFLEQIQRRLAWMDRAGRQISQVDARDPINSNYFALSPDGRQAAFSQRATGISLLDAERGTVSRLSSEADSFPLWSRDGKALVYTSLRDGVRNLYQRSVTGGEPELLLASPGSKAAHDWSPDGRLLLYRDTDPDTRSDLWVVPVEAVDDQSGRVRLAPGGKATPIAKTPGQETNGVFSPDGSWVAYESNESGRQEIYIQPFDRQGTRQRVSLEGGAQPRWRRNGAELFFVALSGQMMSAPLRRRPDGSIDAGAPVPLFPVRLLLNNVQNSQEYDVTADGQQFLVNLVTEARASITAIANWRP